MKKKIKQQKGKMPAGSQVSSKQKMARRKKTMIMKASDGFVGGAQHS